MGNWGARPSAEGDRLTGEQSRAGRGRRPCETWRWESGQRRHGGGCWARDGSAQTSQASAYHSGIFRSIREEEGVILGDGAPEDRAWGQRGCPAYKGVKTQSPCEGIRNLKFQNQTKTPSILAKLGLQWAWVPNDQVAISLRPCYLNEKGHKPGGKETYW